MRCNKPNASKTLMPMKLTLLFFCLFLFSGSACGQDRAARWEEDIDLLETELPKRHNDFYRHYSEPDFHSALDSLRTALPGLEDWAVLLRLQEIICRAGDSHTSVFSDVVSNGPVFPLSLYWFKEGLFVLGASAVSSQDTLLGKQLLAINGIPIEEVAARTARLLVAENESIVRHRLPNLLPSWYLLSYVGVVDGASAIFTFQDTNGYTFNLPLESVPLASFKSALVRYKPASYAFSERDNRSVFWREYLEEEQCLYIRYNRCTSREVEKKYGSKKRAKQQPSFENFEKGILSTLAEKPVHKLVFDVRNNPGGSSPQGARLARQIGQAYKGKVYAVIGRRTFSSAVLNTLDFQEHCGATLVGEPTSGRPNHFGEVKTFELPNSKATVSYSTQYFKRVEGDPATLEPDVRVELSFNEFNRGVDPVWEYIKRQ